jgi:hypothetical protein
MMRAAHHGGLASALVPLYPCSNRCSVAPRKPDLQFRLRFFVIALLPARSAMVRPRRGIEWRIAIESGVIQNPNSVHVQDSKLSNHSLS